MRVYKLLLFGFVAVIAFVVGLTMYSNAYIETETTVKVTVTKTERIADGDNSKYLVFTEHETFENVDSWLYNKYNSSDIYGRLQPGKEYTFVVAGWRDQRLSTYRNIIEVWEH